MCDVTAADLAKQLRAANIVIGDVCEPDALVDGMIVLTNAAHIQVGFHYFNLVLETPEKTLRFLPQRQTAAELLVDIQGELCFKQ